MKQRARTSPGEEIGRKMAAFMGLLPEKKPDDPPKRKTDKPTPLHLEPPLPTAGDEIVETKKAIRQDWEEAYQKARETKQAADYAVIAAVVFLTILTMQTCT